MAPRQKTKEELEALADKAQEVLIKMENDGYEMEVVAIRAYLMAQGEHFVHSRKVQRDVAAELNKQIKYWKKLASGSGTSDIDEVGHG